MKYDLTGQRFGRLIVLGRTKERPNTHDVYWLCKCDCGAEKNVTTGHLSAGTVRSCGCLKKEQAVSRFKAAAIDNIRHGEARSALYGVWHSMIQRCENPNSPSFKWYGGKGVKVCEEWHDYAKFAEWAKANGYVERIGIQRKDRLSIDRVDSNGDYCPGNCRWITVHENTEQMLKERYAKKRPA